MSRPQPYIINRTPSFSTIIQTVHQDQAGRKRYPTLKRRLRDDGSQRRWTKGATPHKEHSGRSKNHLAGQPEKASNRRVSSHHI